MKENPKDIPVVDSLRAGILTRDGFMGEDQRSFKTIIADDAAILASAGTSAVELAAKMEALTQAGLKKTGIEVMTQGYTVLVEDYMGRIGCPFRDHRAAKRTTMVTDSAGRQQSWSALSVHLIKAHGFFQGQGAPYRLEPAELAEFLRDFQ